MAIQSSESCLPSLLSHSAPLSRRRRVAVVVLGLFLGGLVLSTAGEVFSAHVDIAGIGHHQDAPGPDSGDEGAPCGPDCACFCCPGRGMTVVFAALAPRLVAPLANGFVVSLPVALHPRDIRPRIFHPPRA